MRTTLIISVATAALALCSLAAQPAISAPLECKGAVLGIGVTDDAAVSTWEAAALQAYGPGWDNFGLARGKQWGQLNLALAVEQTISASPCRPMKLSQISSNLGNLTLQPMHTEPTPDPAGSQPVFNKKLTKFGKFAKIGG